MWDAEELLYWQNWHPALREVDLQFTADKVTIDKGGEVDIALTVKQHDQLRDNSPFRKVLQDTPPELDYVQLQDANTPEARDDRIWRQAGRRHSP